MNKKNKIIDTNIVFDLGGVLISWQPRKIVEEVLSSSDECDRALNGIFFHSQWREFDTGIITFEQAIVSFVQNTGLSKSTVVEILKSYKNSLHPLPHAEKLIDKVNLENTALFVLSNIRPEIFEIIKSRSSFFCKFKGIVISGEIKLSKPDPQIFEYLLNKYKLNASETVFVDDILENVKGAESVGMQGVVFQGPEDCTRKILSFVNRNVQ